MERAFDDGRFTDVVEGLPIEYYAPFYLGPRMEGRHFVREFGTSPNPVQDARRFVPNTARLIREGLLESGVCNR